MSAPGSTLTAAQAGLHFALERPGRDDAFEGRLEIAGWCFGTTKEVAGVEIAWRGVPHSASYGGLRLDVARQHPQFPGAGASEFRLTVSAAIGDYPVKVIAICRTGERVTLLDAVIRVRKRPLSCSLDTPDLDALKAQPTHFSGWCFDAEQSIASLAIGIGEALYPCRHGFVRDDVANAFAGNTRARESGFEADIALSPGESDVRLEATLANGNVVTHTFATNVAVHRVPAMARALSRVRAHSNRVVHTGRFALKWIRRERRLPRWHELPVLARKARNQLAPQTGADEPPPPRGFRFPVIQDPYQVWLEYNAMTARKLDALRGRLEAARGTLPCISIVMPVFNPDLYLLGRAIESVKRQVLTAWQLCIADDCSTNAEVRPYLADLAQADPRILTVFREENGNISAASNSAAALASGEFLLFLDQDDELAADALAEIALRLAAQPSADVLYTDDDKIDEKQRRYAPQFKPDWSPELLLSYMYMSHALVVRRELFEAIGGFRVGFEGSQDYDFALRATETARRVEHIPLVLYHWRATTGSTAIDADSKPQSYERGERAVQEALGRRGSEARVYRPEWAVRGRVGIFWHEFPDDGPKVSIIIVGKSDKERLRQCFESLARTSYRNCEIVVVDNGNGDRIPLPDSLRHRVLRIDGHRHRSSLSRMRNQAANAVDGDLVLFLDDALEARNPNWLSCMVGYASLAGVGAVGARLLDTQGRLLHAGMIHGLRHQLAGPAFNMAPAWDNGYLSYAVVARDYLAVSAACMLTPRSIFIETGGFDETEFAHELRDADYCYRLHTKGYRTVYAPGAELFAHNANGMEAPEDARELASFRSRYGDWTDPYYSPHLSLEDARFAIVPRAFGSSLERRPVRILAAACSLARENAAQRQLELMVALKARNVLDPIVYAPLDGPLRAEYERHGIAVHVFRHAFVDAMSDERYRQEILTFAEWISSQRCEVVYADTMDAFFAIAASRRAKLPSIWAIRESEPWQTYYRCLGDEMACRALACFAYPYRVVFAEEATRERYRALESRHNFTVVPDDVTWPVSKPSAMAELSSARYAEYFREAAATGDAGAEQHEESAPFEGESPAASSRRAAA